MIQGRSAIFTITTFSERRLRLKSNRSLPRTWCSVFRRLYRVCPGLFGKRNSSCWGTLMQASGKAGAPIATPSSPRYICVPIAVGKRIGSQLYSALLTDLLQRQFHTVIGGIALPNEASVALHKKFGFEKVAHFREVGKKFDQPTILEPRDYEEWLSESERRPIHLLQLLPDEEMESRLIEPKSDMTNEQVFSTVCDWDSGAEFNRRGPEATAFSFGSQKLLKPTPINRKRRWDRNPRS
jgi:hypothetical protein